MSEDSLSNNKSYAPPGWHSVTPRIVARNSRGLVEFLRTAFNCTGEHRTDVPAVVRIGDSLLMISEAGPRNPTPAFLYVYVADVDATYRRTLDAGAQSLEPPADLPYGDRRCMIEDMWGNIWQIATHQG
jgi:PhnB protein